MRRTETSRGLTLTRRQMIGVAGALAATCLFGGTRAARAEGADEKPAGSPSDSEGALFAARARDDSGNPNLWGFIDATGAWVIEPQFEDVASEPGPSYDVGAGVSPLETVYDALYTECMGLTPGVFDGRLAAVKDEESGLWGYIDRTGAWAIEPTYEKAGTFSPDGFAVVVSDGDIHFIREDGSDAFGALAARSATPFCGGVAFVQDGGTEQWACIDVDGEWALESGEDKAHPYVYDAPVFFSEGVGLTRGSDGLAYVDNTGAVQLDFPARARDGYSTRMCVFHQGYMFYMGFFYDKTGKLVKGSARVEHNSELGDSVHGTVDAPPFEREDAPYFASNGLAGVKDYDLTLAGYIDETGEWAIRPQFLEAEPFGEGLAAVRDWATDEYGFINEAGEWVITPRLSVVGWPFKGGLVYGETLSETDHSGWIDQTGSWVCDWGSDAEASGSEGSEDEEMSEND